MTFLPTTATAASLISVVLEFLYVKSKKKGNIGVEASKLLHDDLVVVVVLDAVEVRESKLYLNKLREVAKEHLDKAGPNYLNRLTTKTFLDYLLSLSDVKNNEYMKSYGGHRSALTQLYTQCEIAPTKIFLQKMKQVMSRLKNTSATSIQRPSWR
jgi:hypothetical protein